MAVTWWAGRSTQTVRLLVQHGADVNEAHTNKPPLLSQAVSMRDLDTVRVLLEAGADINAEYQGQTPLLLAEDWLEKAKSSAFDAEVEISEWTQIVQVLQAAGAPVPRDIEDHDKEY